ncbi:MAG TPA: FtsW/RodA/SpoVE family cell cycle protein, partial [Patescibacteria group bacterium]|nr:FtsW/RodA/SpoVE family cell cycle protein [Patescibacteria group bacterium]
MLKFLNRFKYFDIPLQITMLLIIIVGLALLYSTTIGSGSAGIVWRQAAFAGAGLLIFLFFSFFDYHTLAKANRIFYVVLVLLLIYLLTFGSLIRGGRRWIDLGIFNLQVAEFAKIVIILGLSRLLYLRRGEINTWSNIGWSFLYVIIPAGLVVREPDLGSALVLMAIWLGILLMSPIRKKFLIILMAGFLIAGGVTWKFFLQPFQRDRILVFLDPQLDPKGRG